MIGTPLKRFFWYFRYTKHVLYGATYLNEETYAERCSKRIRSVLEYVKEEAFYTDVCVGALSAIPRWRFARTLETREDDSITPRLGNALKAFHSSTAEITRGRNVLAEHLVNRESSADILRMVLYGALMRSYLYLVEKNNIITLRRRVVYFG